MRVSPRSDQDTMSSAPYQKDDHWKSVLVEKTADVIEPLVGPAFTKVGKTFQSWALHFQYKNLLSIGERVKNIHRERGITSDLRTLPDRIAIPLLQSAAMEDEPTLQDLWAGLIANATDPTRRRNVPRVFIDLLKSIEPLDAAIIRYVYKHGNEATDQSKSVTRLTLEDICEAVDCTMDEANLALHNLVRAGLFRSKFRDGRLVLTGDSKATKPPSIVTGEADYEMTSLAPQLITACET